MTPWTEPARTITANGRPGAGEFSVADPRHGGPAKFSNVYRVVAWDQHAAAVTSSRDTAIADPRAPAAMFHNAYRLTPWSASSQTVTGQHTPSNGAGCVADPRPRLYRDKGDDWAGAGHYGVVPWSGRSGAVSSAAGHDNGRWSAADPRPPELSEEDRPCALPAAQDRLVAHIRSMDGTWHRPFTTLELAALQSLVEPEEQLILDGLSDANWRERIGNSVPPAAAQAIADTMGKTLLLAWAGESFMLSAVPIWVRPIAVGLSVQQEGSEA